MKCIDFDSHFADFAAQWMKDHKGDYRNYDAMEADLPRVYMAFLNMPVQWLDGLTPGSYFTQYEDPKVLVDWLIDYCRQEVPVPDMLLEQIQAVGRPCEKRLLALLKDEEGDMPQEAKMTAIGLLRDLESTLPKMLYISWQVNRAAEDELADNAIESLKEMGKSAVQPMLEALKTANAAGQEALLDVLVGYPGNEQIFKLALKLFEENPKRRALFASYLAKLGDDRALPALMAAAKDDNCGYIDFIELRSAIEQLGGEAPTKEFYDDAEYQALHQMEDSQG